MVVVKGGYSEYPLLKGANPDSAECQVTKTLTSHIEAHFKIPKLSSTGRHNLESNRKKGKIRKSGILGGENPQEVCFNMVRLIILKHILSGQNCSAV